MENSENINRRLLWVLAKIAVVVFILYAMLTPIKERVDARSAEIEAEFNEYGCHPVKKEYELCGPVEGKPGFTICEKMTKKVCPDQD